MYFNDENNNTNIDVEFNNNKRFDINVFKNKYILLTIIVIIFLLFFGVIMIIIPKKVNIEYYLTLNGLEDIIIYQGTLFVEPGYQAYDNKGYDYTNDVLISGNVNSSIVGEYVIQYYFNDIIKERTVTVIGEVSQVTYLNLLGNNIIYLKVGEAYNEPGYTVLDSVETDLKNRVVIEGLVDTSKAGTYKLIYSVINSAGVTISAERTVIVMDSDISLNYTPLEVTSGFVTVDWNVISNYFDYVLLPDNSLSYERQSSYIINDNGVYYFEFFDKDGTSYKKEIIIDNIDKNNPVVSCVAEIGGKNTEIFVVANDNGEISNYQYYVNGNLVKNFGQTNYVYNGININNVMVKVNDLANNYTEAMCSIKYLDPSINNPNITYYNAFDSEYVIPKTKNDLQKFVDIVHRNIAQIGLDTCHSSCLSVSLYHAYMLQKGNLNYINVNDACSWKYCTRLEDVYYNTKEEVLYKVYEEINAGRVIVIQINGSTGRHFALVVGYRRKVYRKEDMTEADLLIIDSWDGLLETMDKSINSYARYLWKRPTEGWRVDIFK